MSVHEFEPWLVLGLTLLFLTLLAELGRFPGWPSPTQSARRRLLRPRTSEDCQLCRGAVTSLVNARTVIPYAQRKSPRGRKKTLNTYGYACPNTDCLYFQITDANLHALIGYGHHGRHEPIRDLFCQACQSKFTARRHTALYRLKSPSTRVARVLHAVAEGLSVHAAARVFSLSETTVRHWLARAGQHSQNLHERFMRALPLTHVQLDELRLKLRGAIETTWLWVACDARTKLIPAFALGPRTQALAYQVVHEVARRLAPVCLPVFSSDGLSLYFYALTAHFGEWVQTAGQRHRAWTVNAQLLYAQVIKRYCRRRVAEVRYQVLLGQPEDYRQALRAHSLSGRIQTAFIERLNLTIRRSIASLARRSWSAAHSLNGLALQFEWWRAVYHFAKPHFGLRLVIGESSPHLRYRPRTPAQAAGLTNRRWTVLDVLSCPALPVSSR